MKKTDEEKALENLKILQEVDLISRREFLSVASLLGSATVVANLMTPQSALAWVATRMRKGRVSNDVYAAIDVGDIGHSLRFRSGASATLSRTPGSAGNRKAWTWSGWIKRGILGTEQWLFSAGGATSEYSIIRFLANNTLEYVKVVASAIDAQKTTSAVFRDTSAWLHIVVSDDSTNSAAKIYINGVEQAYGTNDNPSNVNGAINNTIIHNTGILAGIGFGYLDAYTSRVAFVDGQALTPSSFGYLNPNSNSWVTNSQSAVKAIVDAGGTNSFMLDFDDGTSAATLGYDKSTKANNWTATGISLTAGTTYDWMLDTPSNNYCVGSVIDQTGTTISNGGLTLTVPAGANYGRSTFAVSSGKWYFECTTSVASIPGGSMAWGIVKLPEQAANAYISANAWSIYSGATTYNNGATTNTSMSLAVNDIVQVAVDIDAGKIWFGINNTWVGSGNPASGTNARYTNLGSGTFSPMWSDGASLETHTSHINFGQRPFTHTPPTGFKSLCTANLTKPTIANSKKHFDVVARSGNSGSYSVTGLGFTPDFFWTKCRNTGLHHYNVDSVRGNDNVLSSSTTGAENSEAAYITSTAADGYTLGAGVNVVNYNGAGNTYVDWLWKAGGAVVSNSAGTISSQVSANTKAGFSIVTYTGTGVNATVGHGLGTTPTMVMIFARTGGGVAGDHAVYHAHANASPASGVLGLNGTYGFYVTGGPNIWWNNTNPSTTVFSVGTSPMTNASAGTFVAYCFSEISGYSKFGSYTGNASADGPFVYCGFRPRLVMIKRTDSTGPWLIYDSVRDSKNYAYLELQLNSSGQENNVTDNISGRIDILSNGFKERSSSAETNYAYENASGGTYIFVAFAEAPFKYSNAR